VYVYASSDERSRARALAVESSRLSVVPGRTQTPGADVVSGDVSFIAIPRSREVYQSWFVTIFKTGMRPFHGFVDLSSPRLCVR
jgi:hypothetical protein